MADTNLIERTITVSGLTGQGPSRELVAIVDTGATHCQIPEDVGQDIGARLLGDEDIQLPNGRWITTRLWGIMVQLGERIAPTTATLGPAGSPVLVGKFALGQLGFGVDPVENRLIRQVARLLSVTHWPTF